MFKKVIVPVDLSKTSVEIVKCIGALRDFGAEKVLLFHSYGAQTAASLAFSYSTSKLESTQDELAQIVKSYNLDVETKIEVGNTRRQVLKIAKDEDYDLIAVGAEKQSATGALLFGGLAYDIVHSSPKPVLIVRMYKDEKDIDCLKGVPCGLNSHVLYPTDFSEKSDKAYFRLKDMVKMGIKKVTLLHVQEQSRKHEFTEEEIENYNKMDLDRLNTMKKELEDLSSETIKINTIVKVGSPSEETIRLTENEDIQLVIMGFQGRGFVNPLFIGGVSNNVARHADASVLLIP